LTSVDVPEEAAGEAEKDEGDEEAAAPADKEVAAGEEAEPAKDWKTEVPTLQPETNPPPGCIYKRSMTPGPGHYHTALSWKKGGLAFQRKPRGRLDDLVRAKAADPSPGQYEPTPGMIESLLRDGPGGDKVRGVKFSDTRRLQLPVEGQNISPFITREHAKSSNAGIFSPGYFHDVLPSEEEEKVLSKYRRQPSHSIGKAKRM